MYVTEHAIKRMNARLGEGHALLLQRVLEDMDAPSGAVVAYILETFADDKTAEDGSNGNTVVAVANQGSVETVYFRRSTQKMDAQYFGAERIEDIRPTVAY